MFTIKNIVIIWGNDNFNTLGLLRQLGQDDLDLQFLINGEAGIAAKSCYCKKYITTRNIEDGYALLMANYTNVESKPILIASGDEIITFIDTHRSEMKVSFILPGSKKQGLTKKYIDKIQMIDLANEIGILCPKSRALRWDSSISDIEYPCIIKPSHERSGYYNEFKFRICKDKSSLEKILKLVRRDSLFILQQYIPKEKDILIYGGRLLDGQTIIAGAMIRDRWDDCGSASHGLMTSKIPECIDVDLIRIFLERIDYYGLFSFEYAMCDNKAYFFETNLRNDGTSHYFFQAGANVPLAYVYSCAGLDYSHICTMITEDRFYIDEIFDVVNIVHSRLSIKQWKKDMAEATVFKYYDKYDQEPWKLVKVHRLKKIIQDIIIKKYRPYIVFIGSKLGLRKL